MRRALSVIAVLATLPLAGCTQAGTSNSDSTKDFNGDQKAVASTVEDLQTAAKDRKGTTICGTSSPPSCATRSARATARRS